MPLVYFMIAIMPLEESDFWGRAIVGTITIVKLVGFSCLVAAIVRLFLAGTAPRFLYSPQAKWCVALLFVQCLNFVLQGGALESADVAYSHVASILTLFFIVPAMLTDSNRLHRALLVAIGGVGYASLHAVRQQQVYGASTGFRASGMFSDSNQYALLANLWIPLAFLWVLGKRPLWERLVVGGCLCTTVLGTTFAASRGGLIGSAVGLLFLGVRSKKALKKLAVIVAVMLPILLVSPNSPVSRARNPSYGDKQAEAARLVTWKAGLRMLREHPLAGVGIHNFKPRVLMYEDPGEEVVKLAHNTYIELAAETGIPGIVCYLAVLLASIYSMEVSRRRATKARARDLATLALGIQAGLLSFAVSAVFVTAWWEKLAWLMIFASMVVHRACAIRLSAHNRRRLARKAVAAARLAGGAEAGADGVASTPVLPRPPFCVGPLIARIP